MLYLANQTAKQHAEDGNMEMATIGGRRDILLAECNKILFHDKRATAKDKLGAVQMEAKLRRLFDVQPDDDRKAPDPAYLMQYLRECEDLDLCPVCRAREARGMVDDDSGEAAPTTQPEAVPSLPLCEDGEPADIHEPAP